MHFSTRDFRLPRTTREPALYERLGGTCSVPVAGWLWYHWRRDANGGGFLSVFCSDLALRFSTQHFTHADETTTRAGDAANFAR